MPHKRAKRSLRQEERKQQGADHAPSRGSTVSNEDVPKSALRILNATQIRSEYRERKRKREEEDERERKRKRVGGVGSVKEKNINGMAIQPGESLAHFNRRVEDSMRCTVRSAMQSSAAHSRKARKAELDEASSSQYASKSKSETTPKEPPAPDLEAHDPLLSKHGDQPKDFAAAVPRRVNDVAQAPPELKLKKAAKIGAGGQTAKAAGILSVAQRSMMEAERERAIKRYRELKEKQRARRTPAHGDAT
ncbi:hypothetical protein K488DRAFT_90677 [Vararia minispora EC-137]|uniref:Uncharacterized protein n=1 Tax=Vararia minispora EC-137 TaxID=1314806 RepID=A0ACB8Q723_9AGAM|nr:hypothetical protein K488DRAFT_90677 [Vararia minispora EC-137]